MSTNILSVQRIRERPTKIRTVTIEYNNYLSTEPEELIRLNNEYKRHVPELLAFVKKNEGNFVKLLFTRMNPNGSIIRNIVKGIPLEVQNTSFSFFTSETLDKSVFYVDPQKIFVRTDNVLGFIPSLPKTEIYPFENNSEKTLDFLKFLRKTKKLLLSCVGTVHAATIHWWYNKKHKLFREGDYRVEGFIRKVNKSNFEYDHFRTIAYINKEDWYVDVIPRYEIDRFIAPDRVPRKIVVAFGVHHHINPCDDDE
ncbi:MAG: hypothetical protein WC447_02370 [Candidatus Paceibacterota bacterium]|jgi:hypothetical protein